MHCLTSFFRKKYSQFDSKKEKLGHYSCSILKTYKKQKKIVVTQEIRQQRSVVCLGLFVYFLVHKKQGRSKTNFIKLLK